MMNNAIDNPADRREYSRIDLIDAPRSAWLECGDQKGLNAEILDVSLGGARLRIEQGIGNLQGLLRILVEQVEATAEIVWQSATEIGLRFLETAGEAPINILERILKSDMNFAKIGSNVVDFKPA